MYICEFTLFGRPVSFREAGYNSNLLNEWKDYIVQKSHIIGFADATHGQVPADRPIAVLIVQFYSKKDNKDVDNCAKPILDAMQGNFYKNDNLIHSLTYKKIGIDSLKASQYISKCELIRTAFNKAKTLDEDFVYIAIEYVGSDHF